MIRSILLDLGKVIVPFDFAIGYKLLEKRCGHSPALLRERIRATGLVPQFETGLIGSREFVSRLCERVGLHLSFDEFAEIWSAIFDRKTLIPEGFLERLHASYRLILVSNTNALHFEMIRENYPVLRHFDRFVLSYEVHAMKPSPVIFNAAIEAAAANPDECFFTDDIPEYVEGARLCGIDACVFEDFRQLQHDLSDRGVIWDFDRSDKNVQLESDA